MLHMLRVEHGRAAESRVAGVTQWMLRQQAAVQRRWFSAEELINARRSGLVELELEVQKASWLGVEDIREASRVDLHPFLVRDMREGFHVMPDGRAVFENVPPTIPQPKSAWCVLFGGVWRKPLEILRGDCKASVMGLRHACRSTE